MSTFTSSLISAVLANYDFSPISQIVDVGSGHGLLIAEILKANPNMKGILCDGSSVVEGVQPLLETKGVAERCELVRGNFFESVSSGGDAYIMKHIIHDWDRSHTLTILKNCRASMANNGKLLLLETVIPPDNQPSSSKWLDLAVFLMTGGRERKETEYRELLAAAGFKLTKIIYTQSPINLIEAVKV